MNDRANLPMGLVLDMPMQQYQDVDAMSATGLRLFARSPWHYRNRVATTATRPMLRGTLAHCAVLEPHAMSSRYVVVPADAPRRPSKSQWSAKNPSADSQLSMQWWAAFQRSCEGREIVPSDDYTITESQLAALQADDELSALFADGIGEASIFWIDEATGVYCKARPDWMNGARRVKVADLKTMADDTPRGFARSAATLGFHRQLAHYVAGVESLGSAVVDFVFAAVSSVPPVLAIPYRLIDEVVQQGEEEREELLERYAECCRKDQWPAYPPSDRVIDFPAWAKPPKEVEVSYAED